MQNLIDCWIDFSCFWVHLEGQVAAMLATFLANLGGQEWNALGSMLGRAANSDPEPILDRLWADLGRLGDDLWLLTAEFLFRFFIPIFFPCGHQSVAIYGLVGMREA